MIKEIIKSDVGILNKYFLVTLILVLLTIVGYTSYALFSYEEISTTGIRIKYTGKPKQSEGNLANDWKDKTSNELNYLAIYTLGKKDLPETYSYEGTTYTKSASIDVSEQGNGNVILGEYKNGSNIIAVIGQDGKVILPVDSSKLFQNLSKIIILDLSNFNTSNVTNMSNMFYQCTSVTNIIFSDDFNTSNVTNMLNMFCSCFHLSTLDLTSFNTSKVTDMTSMFMLCSDLTQIKVGCNWVIGTSTNTSTMFSGTGTSSVTKVCNE